MNRNSFQQLILKLAGIAILLAIVSCNNAVKKNGKPNVVMIMLDDGGFADFRPFGEPRYPTPNVSKLAEEGCSFYNFYVPHAGCSASRAALLTGSYPGRTGVYGALGPRLPGLDPKFATMGEVMQKNGYVTACFGKWHIGDQPGRRPPSRGFNESCGLMYSHDMWKNHWGRPKFWSQWHLQFWENGKITIEDLTWDDIKMLTTWYTEHAVDFINNHSDEPFFLYVPHSMPHVPISCTDKFRGKSGTGLYGDVIMELDWSVGQIMKALENNHLEENTIFIFIGSDNGPWIRFGNHAGLTPFREGKGTHFDGGLRNSCIIRYPEHLKPNTASHKAFSSIDILPTVCYLTGTQLPENEIDGKNVWDLLTNKPGAENPHDYYASSGAISIMSADGHWKLLLPHRSTTIVDAGKDGIPGQNYFLEVDTTLFDLVHNPYEKGNVLRLYPAVADTLIKYAKKHKDLFYSK